MGVAVPPVSPTLLNLSLARADSGLVVAAPAMSGRLLSHLELPSLASLLRLGSGPDLLTYSRSLETFNEGLRFYSSRSQDFALQEAARNNAERDRSRSLNLRPARTRSLDITAEFARQLSIDMDWGEWNAVSHLDQRPELL